MVAVLKGVWRAPGGGVDEEHDTKVIHLTCSAASAPPLLGWHRILWVGSASGICLIDDESSDLCGDSPSHSSLLSYLGTKTSSTKNLRSQTARRGDRSSVLRRGGLPTVWALEFSRCHIWAPTTSRSTFRQLQSHHQRLHAILSVLGFRQLLEWSSRLPAEQSVTSTRWNVATIRWHRKLHPPQLFALPGYIKGLSGCGIFWERDSGFHGNALGIQIRVLPHSTSILMVDLLDYDDSNGEFSLLWISAVEGNDQWNGWISFVCEGKHRFENDTCEIGIRLQVLCLTQDERSHNHD